MANQNAMLSNAVELRQMAGKAADVRKGCCNVLNDDSVLLNIVIIKVLARQC